MESAKEKMISGQLYNASDPILVQERVHTHEVCHAYNSIPNGGPTRENYLNQLMGEMGKNCFIEPPFFCDYGYNIFLGNDVYFNFNCIVLDGAPVRVGNGVKFGPNVQLYTAGHPLDPSDRAKGLEFATGIEIGDNVWIGGGSILLPGVHIGQNTVIGAGSVVTKSLPADVVAVGNPCRVIKKAIS
ncbi:MAG: sugar O-acetyltransferase [Leptolyngbya sp. SIO1D8]|nr:sugar O-acetyltransferase [Leptolyngbya sp. SIO1D8]